MQPFERGLVVVTILVAVAIGALVAPHRAHAEAGERWWLLLPRAESADQPEITGLPYPPPPNERALFRRSARGRADRVAVLGRGPDRDALQAVLDQGARVRSVSRWLSAVSLQADPAVLVELRARFGDRALRPVRALAGRRNPEPQPLPRIGMGRRGGLVFDYGPSLPQLSQIQVDRLHARGITGHDVRILVLDTGFWLDHPALARLDVIAQYDFVFEDENTADEPGLDPLGQHRHGTGVLGVVAGWDEGDIVGAAPRAEVLLAKTEWVATETRVEEDAFVRALEWGEALGADVMTASLGYRVFPDEPDSFAYGPEDLDGDTAITTRAVDDLVGLGVVAVTSAGNAGPGSQTLLTPADADSVLAVAAVDSLGVIAAFSSRGPTADGRIKPDLAARGRLTVWAETIGGDYAAVNGTSLSAPLVGGAAALVLQAHPDWGPGQVMQALRSTASQSTTPDDALGWGIVRAHDAVFSWNAPQWPLPFDAIHPDPGDTVAASGSEFRWHRSVDLQSPGQVQYVVEFGGDEDVSAVVASFDAGTDTARVIGGAPVGTWWWRVVATDADGHTRRSPARAITLTEPTSADARGLASGWMTAWPNPTAASTHLRLRVSEATSARVEIYDLAGRRVRTLVGEARWPMGERIVVWDGHNEAGRPAASGTYFARAVLRGASGTEQPFSVRLTVVR